VINSDINLKGLSLVPPQKGSHKNGQTHLNVYYQSSSHDDFDDQFNDESDDHDNDQDHTEDNDQELNFNNNDQDHTEDNDQELNFNNNDPYIEEEEGHNTDDQPNVSDSHLENENSQHEDHDHEVNTCEQCGLNHHLDEENCPNIQDDWGNIVLIAPRYTMVQCQICPDLTHTAIYCPYREGGPLCPNSSYSN